MTIRKIIREYLEDIVSQQLIEKEIDEIVDFEFVDKKQGNNGSTTWSFTFKEKEYTINLFIVKTKSEKWYYKLFVYWKQKTNKTTSGRGKDFELQFGPFEKFDDLKKDLEKNIKHNTLFSINNYHDNNREQLNDEIFHLIDDLKKYKEDIENTKKSYFNDLKKVMPELLKSKEEAKIYIDKEYLDSEDKQMLILILQKMYNLKLHNQIDSIKSIF